MTKLRTRILASALAFAGLLGGVAAISVEVPQADESTEIAAKSTASADSQPSKEPYAEPNGYRWR